MKTHHWLAKGVVPDDDPHVPGLTIWEPACGARTMGTVRAFRPQHGRVTCGNCLRTAAADLPPMIVTSEVR